jgi:saccharopine dehydrogenase-like NADP-dependent oxidoreductase
MKLRIWTAIAALCLLNGNAFAACSAATCANVYVDQLYMETSGTLWIRTSGVETALNCTADSGVQLLLLGSAPGFSSIYAMLLAAQQADRLVSIQLVAGSNPCTVVWVTLDRQ